MLWSLGSTGSSPRTPTTGNLPPSSTVVGHRHGDDTNLYHFAVQDPRASGAGLLDNPLAARLHARASVVLAVSWPSLDVATLSILVDGLFGFLLTATESWLARGRHTARDSLVEPLSAALLAGWATAASTDGRVWPS